jgi:3',5'-cyclic AMP phosphodiesterase CpdA
MLIAQISDPHLRPRGVLYKGVVDANAMFASTIRQLNMLSPRPDLVILSGDVVDEGTVAEYDEARAILAELTVPLVIIPGNHDEREAFRACFSDHGYLPKRGPVHFVVDDRGPVRVIGLDVTIPGLHHGLIDESAAVWLDDVLAQAPDRPTIITMHQPPIATHVPYLDAYWCREGHRLAEVVSRYPAVERIACGHVHRFMLARFGETILCTAPSTTTAIALQLRPDAQPGSYSEPPGFLLHHWTAEAGLVTHLVPVGTFPGPYPFA